MPNDRIPTRTGYTEVEQIYSMIPRHREKCWVVALGWCNYECLTHGLGGIWFRQVRGSPNFTYATYGSLKYLGLEPAQLVGPDSRRVACRDTFTVGSSLPKNPWGIRRKVSALSDLTKIAVNVKLKTDYLNCWKLLLFPLPNACRLKVLNAHYPNM